LVFFLAFFFFAMTVFLHITPREEQWPQRDECDMNRLWQSDEAAAAPVATMAHASFAARLHAEAKKGH
jgi:hypothetical protein